jgi:hypothetical protein
MVVQENDRSSKLTSQLFELQGIISCKDQELQTVALDKDKVIEKLSKELDLSQKHLENKKKTN